MTVLNDFFRGRRIVLSSFTGRDEKTSVVILTDEDSGAKARGEGKGFVEALYNAAEAVDEYLKQVEKLRAQ